MSAHNGRLRGTTSGALAQTQDRRSRILFWMLILGLSGLLGAQLQGLVGIGYISWVLKPLSLAWSGYLIGRITLLLLAKDREIVYVERGEAFREPAGLASTAVAPRSQGPPLPPAQPSIPALSPSAAAAIPPSAPWASVYASLKPLRTHPIPLLQAHPDLVKAAEDVKAFPLLEHRFKAPVHMVLEAVQRKYLVLPSLYQQQVLQKRPQPGVKDPSTQWVSQATWLPTEQVSGSRVKVFRRKVVFHLSFVPALARRAAGVPLDMNLEESFEYDEAQRSFVGHVRNVDATHIALFQEVSAFTPHPDNPERETLYRSWMEIAACGWAGKKAMSLLPLSPSKILEKHILTLEARLADVIREGERSQYS